MDLSELASMDDASLQALAKNQSFPLETRSEATHILLRREARRENAAIPPERYKELLMELKKNIRIAPGELLRSALALSAKPRKMPRPKRFPD